MNKNILKCLKNTLSRYKNIRYFIGDVRDKSRMIRACANVDIIIHAAAMKRFII